jgi:hypothetical protein
VATVAGTSPPVPPGSGTVSSRPCVRRVGALLPRFSARIARLGPLVAVFGCPVMQLGDPVAVRGDEIARAGSEFVASVTCMVGLILWAYLATGACVAIFIGH